MKDFKIDFDNNKMLNEFVDKKERVVQQIIVSCRSWLEDFFLNENFGINYDNSWGDQDFMEMFIKDQILAIDGVDSINKIDISKKRNTLNEVQYYLEAEIVYDKDLFVISDFLIYQ